MLIIILLESKIYNKKTINFWPFEGIRDINRHIDQFHNDFGLQKGVRELCLYYEFEDILRILSGVLSDVFC